MTGTPDGRELPPLDRGLVVDLDERFPDKCPDLDMSDREIWVQAGQRSVIDFLIEHFRKQQDD